MGCDGHSPNARDASLIGQGSLSPGCRGDGAGGGKARAVAEGDGQSGGLGVRHGHIPRRRQAGSGYPPSSSKYPVGNRPAVLRLGISRPWSEDASDGESVGRAFRRFIDERLGCTSFRLVPLARHRHHFYPPPFPEQSSPEPKRWEVTLPFIVRTTQADTVVPLVLDGLSPQRACKHTRLSTLAT